MLVLDFRIEFFDLYVFKTLIIKGYELKFQEKAYLLVLMTSQRAFVRAGTTLKRSPTFPPNLRNIFDFILRICATQHSNHYLNAAI